ncbi:hypothetical protein CDAR_90321 [Caerostris darwini]|uniref:Uncharacterized protein n=1 Tax=Caerostris darwini TaxID=1538125 RepID=A0AAV4NQX3_9ARAC|nr:hypothetical protein CDAR_90321 [Caerostris darwini]
MAWAVIDEALPINNALRQEQAPNLLFLEGILLRRPGIFFPFHFVFFFPSFPSQIHCEGKGEYITREEMEPHFSTHLTLIARGKRGLDEGEKRRFRIYQTLTSVHPIGEFARYWGISRLKCIFLFEE